MNSLLRRSGLAAAMCLGLLTALPAAAAENPLFNLQHEWWQWIGSIPLESNPLLDTTGKSCDVGQRGSYWFLASNTGGSDTRSCTVPKGVKLLVPVINSFCYPEEGFDTDESCIEFVNEVMDGYRPADMTVRLDGRRQRTEDICEIAVAPNDQVSGLPQHCVIRRRGSRTLFNFVIGESGFYPSDPGVWRANSARGVWSVIDTSNLAVGEHVVNIRAVGKPGAVIPFLAVSYNLTVADPVN